MCERSKTPTRSRTARCSSRMPEYWTGISQPAKSMSRPPSARWRSTRAVCSKRCSSCGGALQAGQWQGLLDELALGREGQQRQRFGDRKKADVLELMIVVLEAPAGRLHQEEVDRLVDALARLREEIIDRAHRREDAHLEAGLLDDL